MNGQLEAARSSLRALMAVTLALIVFVSSTDVAAPYRNVQTELQTLSDLDLDEYESKVHGAIDTHKSATKLTGYLKKLFERHGGDVRTSFAPHEILLCVVVVVVGGGKGFRNGPP